MAATFDPVTIRQRIAQLQSGLIIDPNEELAEARAEQRYAEER